MSGMGGHQSPAMLKDEWLTPPEILCALGKFDLDPCAPVPERRPWPMAGRHYTLMDDGLSKPWKGRVWLNPPYGRQTGEWLARLADHGNGIALVFARTETEMFFNHIWGKADSVLFIRGRLFFHHATGARARHNSGAPSCLVAYGRRNTRALRYSNIPGYLVDMSGTLL